MRLTQLATVAPLRRAPHFSRVFSFFFFFSFRFKLEENNCFYVTNCRFLSLSLSLSISLFLSIFSFALSFSRFLSISLSLTLVISHLLLSLFHSQLSNLGDVSLHKLFKNNILHYNVCIIYRGHLIRIKFVKQHRKIALTGPGNMITATQCRASII